MVISNSLKRKLSRYRWTLLTLAWLTVVTPIFGFASSPVYASPNGAPMLSPEDYCSGFIDTSRHNDQWCYALEEMVSLGAVEGYPGPTFAPDNLVTRGQFCKILVKGFEWTIPYPLGHHFQDVPPGSTFYDYVETAYGRNLITGYPCGGSGEPCIAPNYLPYFRLGNNVTRSQMAKMTSQAANFSDTAPGSATFSDVPVGSTFFPYVERLVKHISTSPFPPDYAPQPSCTTGYPCFFPGQSAPRSDTVQHIYLAKINQSSSVYGRAFSMEDTYPASFDGVRAGLSTPGNSMAFNGQFTAGPVALAGGWEGNGHFIESGPERRNVSGSYQNYPYGSAFNNWNPPAYGRDTTFPLTPGVSYQYRSYYAGSFNGHEWWGEFYDGSNWRRVVTMPNMGVSALSYIAIAAETSAININSGTLQVTNAQYHSPGGSWSGWCWDTSMVPRKMFASTFGTCTYSPTNGLTWSVAYTR